MKEGTVPLTHQHGVGDDAVTIADLFNKYNNCGAYDDLSGILLTYHYCGDNRLFMSAIHTIMVSNSKGL